MKSFAKINRHLSVVAVGFLALGFLGLGGFAGAPRQVAAATDCAGQELAGRWVNRARPEGSDLLAAQIRIPCTGPAAAAGLAGPTLTPPIAVQLSINCLHLMTCDWQPVPAVWSAPTTRNGNPVLSAHIDQERFDRSIAIEPIEGGRLRLTMTSRFKGLVVAPTQAIYTLERPRG